MGRCAGGSSLAAVVVVQPAWLAPRRQRSVAVAAGEKGRVEARRAQGQLPEPRRDLETPRREEGQRRAVKSLVVVLLLLAAEAAAAADVPKERCRASADFGALRHPPPVVNRPRAKAGARRRGSAQMQWR